MIGGAIGSFAAGTAADITTGLVGLNEGGVLTRSLIAEGGQPEIMIPFDDIGKNITEIQTSWIFNGRCCFWIVSGLTNDSSQQNSKLQSINLRRRLELNK